MYSLKLTKQITQASREDVSGGDGQFKREHVLLWQKSPKPETKGENGDDMH